VTRLLEAKVKKMVAGAQQRAAGQADALLLPLVRLRVDYTGFSTINAQRFGQQFVGKVANPHDLLLFQKAPARKPKACSPLIPFSLECCRWGNLAGCPWSIKSFSVHACVWCSLATLAVQEVKHPRPACPLQSAHLLCPTRYTCLALLKHPKAAPDTCQLRSC
jgi:hypothetical protein